MIYPDLATDQDQSVVPPYTGEQRTPLRAVRVKILLLAVLFLGLHVVPAVAQADDPAYSAGYRIFDVRMPEKTVTTAVWYPADREAEAHAYGSEDSANRGRLAMDAPISDDRDRYPLLCYSHGFGGSGLGSTYLAEFLARRGWIVVAPDHHDPVNVIRIRGGQQNGKGWTFLRALRELIRNGDDFDFEKYAYREHELRAVMNHVLDESSFADRIDRSSLAVGGHSFGGYTALRVSGARGDPYEPGFRAILLHSPGIWMYDRKQFRRIDRPVLYMLGQNETQTDRLGRTKKEWATFALDSMQGRGYYFELKDGDHLSFNTGQRDNWLSRRISGSDDEHAIIRKYSTAFLDYHVLGRDSGLEDLRTDEAGRSAFTEYPRSGTKDNRNGSD